MRLVRVAFLVATLLAGAAASAQDKPCTPADAAKAEKAIDMVLGWGQLHKAWMDHRHCDTGAVADVFTDALLRLMVPWNHIDSLAATMQKDPEFRKFVHAHLKSPAAKDDRSTVSSRARLSCPKGMDTFCAELADVVREEK